MVRWSALEATDNSGGHERYTFARYCVHWPLDLVRLPFLANLKRGIVLMGRRLPPR